MSGHGYPENEGDPVLKFQSPDGDSLCPDKEGWQFGNAFAKGFQSPDGDSLCPDFEVVVPLGPPPPCFSPLTGILYVRTLTLSCLGDHGLNVSVP